MKLSCLQEELKRGLTTVGRAVPGRTTLPSAKNILFSTEKSRLKLTATNLAVSITTWIPASVEEEGEVTVPANIVTELVSSLQSDRVAMEVPLDTLVMRVECGHSRANINGAEPADFPPSRTSERDQPPPSSRESSRKQSGGPHSRSQPTKAAPSWAESRSPWKKTGSE